MNKRLRSKIVELSKELIHLPKGSNKHFSFIIDKNKIHSIGYNNYYRTHPIGKKLGYIYDGIHSELDAFIKLRNKKNITQLSLVNVRINHKKQVAMSRPCIRCMPWIQSIGFKHVYYTDVNGEIIKEW